MELRAALAAVTFEEGAETDCALDVGAGCVWNVPVSGSGWHDGFEPAPVSVCGGDVAFDAAEVPGWYTGEVVARSFSVAEVTTADGGPTRLCASVVFDEPTPFGVDVGEVGLDLPVSGCDGVQLVDSAGLPVGIDLYEEAVGQPFAYEIPTPSAGPYAWMMGAYSPTATAGAGVRIAMSIVPVIDLTGADEPPIERLVDQILGHAPPPANEPICPAMPAGE